MEELQKRLAGSNHDGHDQLLIFARADAIFPIESTVAEAAHYVLFHHLLTENENR